MKQTRLGDYKLIKMDRQKFIRPDRQMVRISREKLIIPEREAATEHLQTKQPEIAEAANKPENGIVLACLLYTSDAADE